MALQYRRSATGGGGGKAPAVDWELYEETLARVDPRFSDPRFDSLKHVLTVLSSSNAEQEVAEVRGRSMVARLTLRCRHARGEAAAPPPAAGACTHARHSAPTHLPLPFLYRRSCGSSGRPSRSWWTRWCRATTRGSTSPSTTTPSSSASSQTRACRCGGCCCGGGGGGGALPCRLGVCSLAAGSWCSLPAAVPQPRRAARKHGGPKLSPACPPAAGVAAALAGGGQAAAERAVAAHGALRCLAPVTSAMLECCGAGAAAGLNAPRRLLLQAAFHWDVFTRPPGHLRSARAPCQTTPPVYPAPRTARCLSTSGTCS